jgi:prophage regulatory protein
MEIGFYNAKQVVEMTTFSRTTIWRAVRNGSFPRPVKLSAGRKGWPREVIHNWIKEKLGGQLHVARNAKPRRGDQTGRSG